MSGLPWLDPYDDEQAFPHPERALAEPDGLLAVGGSLTPRRLLRAYRMGIFPWYSSGQPILWWSPDPRTVIYPAQIKISRSLRKTIRQERFSVTMDTVFTTVIQRCSEPRDGEVGTWITPEMRMAYGKLHQLGYAHSVETWQASELVGGLYGVAIGQVFYGESMFSRVTDASKVALVALAMQLMDWGYALIDCQMHTSHLLSMGAEDIPRRTFLSLLNRYCPLAGHDGPWQFNSMLFQPGHLAAWPPTPTN